jgi:hypothetical protein
MCSTTPETSDFFTSTKVGQWAAPTTWCPSYAGAGTPRCSGGMRLLLRVIDESHMFTSTPMCRCHKRWTEGTLPNGKIHTTNFYCISKHDLDESKNYFSWKQIIFFLGSRNYLFHSKRILLLLEGNYMLLRKGCW